MTIKVNGEDRLITDSDIQEEREKLMRIANESQDAFIKASMNASKCWGELFDFNFNTPKYFTDLYNELEK